MRDGRCDDWQESAAQAVIADLPRWRYAASPATPDGYLGRGGRHPSSTAGRRAGREGHGGQHVALGCAHQAASSGTVGLEMVGSAVRMICDGIVVWKLPLGCSTAA